MKDVWETRLRQGKWHQEREAANPEPAVNQSHEGCENTRLGGSPCTARLLRVQAAEAPRHRDVDTGSWKALELPERSERWGQGTDSVRSNCSATD